MLLKIKYAIKKIPISYKKKVDFVDTLSRRTKFWDTSVPCGSENSNNVVQLNPLKINTIFSHHTPTLMQPLKKSHQKALENPNIDLQSNGIYSKSDIQHHIRTQQIKIYSQKWTQYNDNPYIKTYANLKKQQAFHTYKQKTIEGILKI